MKKNFYKNDATLKEKEFLKICFVLDGLGCGGAERVASILANAFFNKGHDVSIFLTSNYTNDSFYEVNNKIKIVSCLNSEKDRKHKAKRIKILKNKLLSLNPDVVIAFLPHVCAYAYFALKGTNIPLVVSERSDPNRYNFIYKILLKYIFKRASGCVFQTNDAMEWYGEKVRKKAKIIYNPVRIDKNHLSFKTNSKSKVIFSVGRLCPQKNFPLLINAFDDFSKKFDDYQLNIYGEGPEKNNLQKLIIDKKLETKVFLKGASKTWHRDEINSSLFVMSSKVEGMPNALVEALSLGIPSISTNCPIGGPRELKTIFPHLSLVENNNKDSLVAEMIHKIQHPIINSPNSVKTLSVESISNTWINFIKSL